MANGPLPWASRLDEIGEAVCPDREHSAHLGAHRHFGLLVERRKGVERHGAAEALEELAKAPLAEPDGGGQRPRVAALLQREAGVAHEDAEDLLVQHALAIEPHRRHHQPFLEDLRRARRHRAGLAAADIGEMRPGLRERRQLAVDENRRGEDLVVQVRDAAARGVAVVVPIKVTRPHGLGGIDLEDGIDDMSEQRNGGRRDQPAMRIEERGEEILLLADDIGHRGALEQRLGLGLRGAQGTLDNLQGHRVGSQATVGKRAVIHGCASKSDPKLCEDYVRQSKRLEVRSQYALPFDRMSIQ